jgi:hypothetical protein
VDILQGDLLPSIACESDQYIRRALVSQLHSRLNSLKRYCQRKANLHSHLLDTLTAMMGSDVSLATLDNDLNEKVVSDKVGLASVIEREEEVEERVTLALRNFKLCRKDNTRHPATTVGTTATVANDRVSRRSSAGTSDDVFDGDQKHVTFSLQSYETVADVESKKQELNGHMNGNSDGQSDGHSDGQSNGQSDDPTMVKNFTRQQYDSLLDLMRPYVIHRAVRSDTCWTSSSRSSVSADSDWSHSNDDVKVLREYIIQLTNQINRLKQKVDLLANQREVDNKPTETKQQAVSDMLQTLSTVRRGFAENGLDKIRPTTCKPSFPSAGNRLGHEKTSDENTLLLDQPRLSVDSAISIPPSKPRPVSASAKLTSSKRRMSNPTHLSNLKTPAEFNKWMHTIITQKPSTGLRASIRANNESSNSNSKVKDKLSANANPTLPVNNSPASSTVSRTQNTGFLKLLLDDNSNETVS